MAYNNRQSTASAGSCPHEDVQLRTGGTPTTVVDSVDSAAPVVNLQLPSGVEVLVRVLKALQGLNQVESPVAAKDHESKFDSSAHQKISALRGGVLFVLERLGHYTRMGKSAEHSRVFREHVLPALVEEIDKTVKRMQEQRMQDRSAGSKNVALASGRTTESVTESVQ